MTTATCNTSACATKPTEHAVQSTEQTRGGSFFRPNCDIVETADELRIYADVPGATGDDIDIHFEKGALTIHAKVHDRRPTEPKYALREYGVGGFFRTFQVDETIDTGRIRAEVKGGVLTLHLPKSETVKPRKIAVLSA